MYGQKSAVCLAHALLTSPTKSLCHTDYKEGHCSTAACGAQENYPDDQYYMTPRVGKGPPFNWEGREVTAPFASGVAFTFKIDANAQKSNDFETVGWGQNKFHHYSCKKDNKRELWHASGGGFAASCKSIYYCLVGN